MLLSPVVMVIVVIVVIVVVALLVVDCGPVVSCHLVMVFGQLPSLPQAAENAVPALH